MVTMPPLPPVPNVIKAQLLWSDAGDADVRSNQYFRYSGGTPSPTDANVLAAGIYAAMATHSNQWGEDTQLTGVEVTDLASAGGGQGLHAESTTGTRLGTPVAGGTAVVVGYVIGRRYRGGKPRNYFPFFTSSDLATRQGWAAGNVTALNSALATYFAAVIGLSSGTTTITEHVNVSYYSGFTVVISPTTGRSRNVPKLRLVPDVDDITSFGTRVQPGSQRRRNR